MRYALACIYTYTSFFRYRAATIVNVVKSESFSLAEREREREWADFRPRANDLQRRVIFIDATKRRASHFFRDWIWGNCRASVILHWVELRARVSEMRDFRKIGGVCMYVCFDFGPRKRDTLLPRVRYTLIKTLRQSNNIALLCFLILLFHCYLPLIIMHLLVNQCKLIITFELLFTIDR